MFDFLTDSVDNALKVADGLIGGEPPSRREVAKLIADGATVAGIAVAAGVSIDVIEQLLEDD